MNQTRDGLMMKGYDLCTAHERSHWHRIAF